MNKKLCLKYNDVCFDKNQVEMIIELIQSEEITYEVFIQIAKRTKTETNKEAVGITTSELSQIFYGINASTKIKTCISILRGGTLIYYEDGKKFNQKKYQVTRRGFQIASEIIKRKKGQ